jgi:predicted RNase H-like nuclease (RuvC/YqgF family)
MVETMTVLLQRIMECEQTIRKLRGDNHRVRRSREEWKQKYRDLRWETENLRRAVTRARRQRDSWRAMVPRRKTVEWKNVHLSERDLERIRRMPVR